MCCWSGVLSLGGWQKVRLQGFECVGALRYLEQGHMVAAAPPVWFALAGSWWQIAGNEVIARKCLDRTGVFDTF